MKIEDLIKRDESKTLEFKENLNSKSRILATVIAFSNTAGGKLVIGIGDKKHNIVGVDNPHKAEEAIASTISDSIEPTIVPNIEIVPWRDTHIIVIDIYPGPNRPYYLKDKGEKLSTYIRVGSTNRLGDQGIINFIKRSLVIKGYDEEALHEADSEDIDLGALSECFKPRVFKKTDLYTLGLLVKEQNKTFLSVGGMLLFGKNKQQYFPDAWIQVGRFGGKDKSHIIDQYNIKDNLARSIEEAIDFVQKHIFAGVEINAIKNHEVWSIPKIAIREAIINAVVHADYSLQGAPIRVSIFDDRIEVENPGLLAIGLTIDDIISGISKLRNRVIARVFHELRLIEQWGSGIQRIISSCENMGLRLPLFEEVGNRFKVTLYKEQIKPIHFSEGESKIINTIKSYGALSTKDIARHVDLTTRSVRSKLDKMVEKNLIVCISRGKNDPKKLYSLKK